MKQCGVVLLTTVTILALLALIMLHEWQLVFLHNRMITHLKSRTQAFDDLENLAGMLMKDQVNCATVNGEPDDILAQLPKTGCVRNWQGRSYRFLMEDLGLFPCLQIKKQTGSFSTRHWRLSLSDGLQTLQLRFVVPDTPSGCVRHAPIFLDEGLVSWRYLSAQV